MAEHRGRVVKNTGQQARYTKFRSHIPFAQPRGGRKRMAGDALAQPLG
jgi:hypothetical protein